MSDLLVALYPADDFNEVQPYAVHLDREFIALARKRWLTMMLSGMFDDKEFASAQWHCENHVVYSEVEALRLAPALDTGCNGVQLMPIPVRPRQMEFRSECWAMFVEPRRVTVSFLPKLGNDPLVSVDIPPVVLSQALGVQHEGGLHEQIVESPADGA